MACEDFETRLEDYLNGQLSSSGVREVEAHLAACAGCRQALEDAKPAGQLLRLSLATAGEPSSAFWPRLLAAIRAEEAQRQRFWRPLEVLSGRVAWSAAVALFLLAAYLVTVEHPPKHRQSPAQSEVSELFPEPVHQPADRDEVLMTLATGNQGR